MQEKVHPTPPIMIKMVEGKPPPNSWVNENIVQYLQDQSQSHFLKDVLAYAQSLQAKQLEQTRYKAISVSESFATIPEEGGAEDISHAASYNTAQGLVKTQLETLEKLILLMQQGNPKLGPQMNDMMSELRQAAQAFPHLTPQQMQNLNTLLQQLNRNASDLPNPYQKYFWNNQVKMLQSMMGDIKGNIQDYEDEIHELQARIQMLQKLILILQEMKKALTSKPPSEKQFLEMIENLQTLANQSGQLNPAESQALNDLFQQLNQFKTKSGKSLTQVIANVLVQNKIEAFKKANPQAKEADLTSFLKSFLQESNLQGSSLSFLQSLGDSIEDVLSKKSPPDPTILADFSASETSEEAIGKAMSRFTQTSQDEITVNQKKIEGFTDTVKDLSKLQDNFGKSAAWAVAQAYSSGELPSGHPLSARGGLGAAQGLGDQPSLPNEFSNAILNKYMPHQQQFLEALAEILFLDNMGAQFGNTLMSLMTGFGSAGTSINFAGGATSAGNGNYNGSVEQAKAALSKEKTEVSKDINSCNSAISHINSEINQINEKLKHCTPSQAKILNEMKQKLEHIHQDLFLSLASLNTLQMDLANFKISPPNPPATASKAFTVSGWPSSMGDWQQTVGADEKGSVDYLNKTSADVTAFQQNYADQSQQQQMMLQMRMTEIQQEWTVVSTAMQLLNQMYMSLAQGIYK